MTIHRRLAALLVAFALALTLALAPHTTHAGAAGVTIVNLAFQPSSTSIHVGDSVTWTWSSNNNGTPHTTTSDPGSAVQWDSGQKTKGTYSVAFNAPGTFTYHCNVHPDMKGTITVLAQPAATATPTPSPVPTAAPTSTPTPGATYPPGATATPTPMATATAVATGTSVTPTDTATLTATVAATATATPTAADTPTPTPVPSTPATLPTLQLAASGRLVRGHDAALRVSVTADGQVVSHASVVLDARKVGIRPLRRGVSNSHGQSIFRHLRPARTGMVAIRASHSGYRPARMKLAVRP